MTIVQGSRYLSTTSPLAAGFQGTKGSGTYVQAVLVRKKRLIQRLEKQALQPKPVKDLTVRYSWKQPERKRPVPELTAEELERRILLQKDWCRHVTVRSRAEDARIKKIKRCQEKALYELRKESETLFQAAIERDTNFEPFVIEGPSETPPLLNCLSPLGCTVHWEEEF